MPNDDAFLEVLAGCTEACANMDLSDDGWMPPDGQYDVMIEDVSSGLKEKNSVNNAWVKPTFSILDGEFQGRSFTDYYWIPGGVMSGDPPISVKNLCRFATCLVGSETRIPLEAVEIAKAGIGEFLTIEVYRTNSKKTGKTYPNIRFLQRLEAKVVEDTEENAEVKE